MKTILFFLLTLPAFAATREITLVNHQYEGTKQWLPGFFKVQQGEIVKIKLINNAPSGVHGFEIKEYKIRAVAMKGKPAEVEFKADRPGVYAFKCHLHPTHVGGQFEVVPNINQKRK